MNKVSFSAWDNDVEEIIREINRVANQIQSVEKKLKTNDMLYDDFELFFDNVCQTLCQWIGHTYIGHKKDKSIQKAFQNFFEALYKFLIVCQEIDYYNLQQFAKRALFRGTLYRYLGHGSIKDSNSVVEPEYNDIYVSWSKHLKNSYIQSKLYGTITLLTCKVDEPYYGIDLDAFDVVKGKEAEVVFPTVKETIMEIIIL